MIRTRGLLAILLFVQAGLPARARPAASGQDWDLTLTSEEELTRQKLLWIKGDSLVVKTGDVTKEEPRIVAVEEVERLRRVSVNRTGGGITKRALSVVVGGVAGYGAGTLFYRLVGSGLSNNDTDNGQEFHDVFAYGGTLVGIMHGMSWGVMEKRDTLAYDLSALSLFDKRDVVHQLVKSETPRQEGIMVRVRDRLDGRGRFDWEVGLTSGQVYTHADLGRLTGDSLDFRSGPGSFSVPVGNIQSVTRRAFRGRTIRPVIGGILGLYSGSVVGRVLSDKVLELPEGSPVKPFPVVVGTVLGAVLGAGYVHETVDRYDLSGLTDEEKVRAFRMFILPLR